MDRSESRKAWLPEIASSLPGAGGLLGALNALYIAVCDETCSNGMSWQQIELKKGYGKHDVRSRRPERHELGK